MNIARHAAVWLTALWVMASAPASWAAAGGAARVALPPVESEVIVQFKADATVLRKHALAARAAAPTVQAVLGQRAAALGARVGYALAAGQPVGDRMQVMRASGMSAEALAARLAPRWENCRLEILTLMDRRRYCGYFFCHSPN